MALRSESGRPDGRSSRKSGRPAVPPWQEMHFAVRNGCTDRRKEKPSPASVFPTVRVHRMGIGPLRPDLGMSVEEQLVVELRRTDGDSPRRTVRQKTVIATARFIAFPFYFPEKSSRRPMSK